MLQLIINRVVIFHVETSKEFSVKGVAYFHGSLSLMNLGLRESFRKLLTGFCLFGTTFHSRDHSKYQVPKFRLNRCATDHPDNIMPDL